MDNISLFKLVISDQKREIDSAKKQGKIINRDLSSQEIKSVFEKGPGVIVVQGVRRCGKSTYAINALDEKYLYINFDDERLIDIKAKDLNDLLSASYEIYGDNLEYFIFDEIQNIFGWELFISRLEKTRKIIVTGSNANLLSKELATHLTGRYKTIILYPFSLREFIKSHELKKIQPVAKLSTAERSLYQSLLSRYIQEGGFPDVQKFGESFSQNIYSDIINKDILRRYKLRAPVTFKKFALYLISNCSSEINFNKVAKFLTIKDPHTVARYSSYLEEAYLIFTLNQYFHKLKAQLSANKKLFAIDTGLVNTTAFRPSSMLSAHYENLVFLELLRLRDYQKKITEIFFWQNNNSEVDFVIRNKGTFEVALQVCLDFSRIETFAREIKGLVNINRELKIKKLLLINESVSKIYKEDGVEIQAVTLLEFLLEPERFC